MARILAIDYGMKRSGIAVTDELQLIASGLTTVPTAELLDFISDYVQQEPVELLLVGEPRQMNNEPSEIESQIQIFLAQLLTVLPTIPVERVDERFTSKIAYNTLKDRGLKIKTRQDKALLDEISATLILQNFLNSR